MCTCRLPRWSNTGTLGACVRNRPLDRTTNCNGVTRESKRVVRLTRESTNTRYGAAQYNLGVRCLQGAGGLSTGQVRRQWLAKAAPPGLRGGPDGSTARPNPYRTSVFVRSSGDAIAGPAAIPGSAGPRRLGSAVCSPRSPAERTNTAVLPSGSRPVVSGEASIDRLAKQTDDAMPAVLACPAVGQDIARQAGQPQGIVEFTIGLSPVPAHRTGPTDSGLAVEARAA